MKPVAFPSEKAHQASNVALSPAAAAVETTVASATAVVMVQSAPTVSTPQADIVHHASVRRDLAASTIRPVRANSDSAAAEAQWTIAHRTGLSAMTSIW